MGVGPGDARKLTWWEFTAMKAVWNERHAGEDDAVEPPPADLFRAEMARYGQAVH